MLLNRQKTQASARKTHINIWFLAGWFVVTANNSLACEGIEHKTDSTTPTQTANLTTTANNSFFSNQEVEFLPVEEAFKLSSTSTLSGLTFIWTVAKDYYLYKHQFSITTAQGLNVSHEAIFMPGTAKQDEYFGEVEVYYYQAIIELPFTALGCETAGNCPSLPLSIKYQGCAEAGLCYPIQSEQVNIDQLL